MAARRPLDRPQVLQGALGIIDEEGLEALTMRRLGQRLDRNPMVLYRYAASRNELLDGVVERVFALLQVPDRSGAWMADLVVTARRFREIALLHPNLIPLLATRPFAIPLGLRPLGTLVPVERVLALLEDAGFEPPDALRIQRAFFALLIGHVLTEQQEVVVEPDETDAVLRLGLQRLPVREFPRIRALAEELLEHDGATDLDGSVTALLTGLSARFERERRLDP